jgi:hypothetical protein
MGPTTSSPPTSRDPNDTLWFVYADERHQGPFSTAEVQTKLIDESLGPDDYLWKTGMADWDPISKFELFYPDSPVPIETPISSPDPEPKTYVRTTDIYVERVNPRKDSKDDPTGSRGQRAGILLLAMALLYMGYDLSNGHSKKIDEIRDISIGEGQTLRRAAEAPVRDGKFPVEIVSALGNAATPAFYVAAHVPDGTVFELRVDGIPGTLLTHSEFHAREKMTFEGGVARTSAITRRSGHPIARGRYRISVVDPHENLLQTREIFLGGVEDENYRLTRAAMSANEPKQRLGELTELRQITGALEDQLTQTAVKFRSPKNWAEFSRGWKIFGSQLEQELRESPSDIDEVVYLELFTKAREVLGEIKALHARQSSALADRRVREQSALEIAQSTARVQSEIIALENIISVAEQALPSRKKR